MTTAWHPQVSSRHRPRARVSFLPLLFSISLRSFVRPSLFPSPFFRTFYVFIYTPIPISPANRTDPLCCSHTQPEIHVQQRLNVQQISAHGYRFSVSVREKSRAIEISMCVYAYITELSTRLSVSQSAPLEYHSPSLCRSLLFFLSFLPYFLHRRRSRVYGVHGVDEFEEDTRNGFPFTSDTTRVFRRRDNDYATKSTHKVSELASDWAASCDLRWKLAATHPTPRARAMRDWR